MSIIKQKKIILLWIFLSFYLFLQAQQTVLYDSKQGEEFNQKVKAVEVNDNWRYFHDIAIENGLYIPTNEKTMSSGSIMSLHGSYFFTDKFGFRSGLSLISGMDGSDKYLKIPLLFSFRTEAVSFAGGNDIEFESFREALINFLINVVPKRFEFNAGFSLGYMTPKADSTHIFNDGGKLMLAKTFEASRRFASSLDANMRMSYQIWRIGLNINIGINYLWTKNYNHHDYYPINSQSQPSLFANLGIGASFRF